MKELTPEVFLEEANNMSKALWGDKAPSIGEDFLEFVDELGTEFTCYLLGKGYSSKEILSLAENELGNISDEETEVLVGKLLEEKE